MSIIGSSSKKIVKAILADLTDRRGLRHEWERIDEDIQKEIEATWVEIATKILTGVQYGAR